MYFSVHQLVRHKLAPAVTIMHDFDLSLATRHKYEEPKLASLSRRFCKPGIRQPHDSEQTHIQLENAERYVTCILQMTNSIS